MIEIKKDIIEKLDDIFSSKCKISLIFHSNPDGDAVGSSLGLYLLLKKLGNEVNIISPDPYPEFLQWLPSNEHIIIFKNEKERAVKTILNSETIVCLDFNKLDRIKEIGDIIIESKAKTILIDHHLNPDDFPDIVVTETDISSTAELLYHTLILLGYRKYIDKDIATCLFAGIMTDTGAFSYGFKNPSTFEAAADMLSFGINKDEIYNKIYNNFTEDRTRLMGYCLNNKMEVLKEYSTAFISITQEEFRKFNYQTGDTEGFVNLPLSIKGINFSVLFTEQRDHIKMSFRSKGDFNTNSFAKKHFNGGGHKNASGGQLFNISMEETIEKFKSLLPEYSKTLSQ